MQSVALNAAEEESIEALKRWWDENGKQLALLVLVVFGGYTAWILWQNSQASNSEQSSNLYEEILNLAAVEPGVQIDQADRLRIRELATDLRENYSGSVYARYASLFSAQQAVALNDLEAAEAELQWILDNTSSGIFSAPDQGLSLTASLRLGRVILARGDAERALVLVNSLDPGEFEAGFAELRGDIYAAMGRLVDARDAYLAAQQAGSGSDALRMKLNELADQG
ncbi:MAG: tetratricopeptide repeat protein [Gammaproteobacteria bacterium]